jgi:hypothetical protein
MLPISAMTLHIGVVSVTALVGAITGTAALVLSIKNYLRDNPRIKVMLRWDMSITDNPRYDRSKLWGLVSVANVGRRPIHVRIAHLKLAKGYKYSHLVISEGIAGKSLPEGDAPAIFMISQEGMQEYAKDWRKIRAAIYDSAGREYLSPKTSSKDPVPSWAKGNP